MLISFILPIRNESIFIEKTLNSVLNQSGDFKSEIIISDGMSTDGTRDIVKNFQLENSFIQLIDNPEKIVSTGFNRALSVAKGNIIIRVDGHTTIDKDYLIKSVSNLINKKCDCTGGLIKSDGDSIIAKNIFYILKPKIKINPSADISLSSINKTMDIAIENYIKWIKSLKAVCLYFNIELIVATQPYYLFGQDINKVSKKDLAHLDNINNFFDDIMLKAYEKLDSELNKIQGIKYLPIFKLYKNLKLNLYTDAVHLKTDGYQIIAEYIHKQIGAINVNKNY